MLAFRRHLALRASRSSYTECRCCFCWGPCSCRSLGYSASPRQLWAISSVLYTHWCLRSPLWQFPEESAQCQHPIFLGHSDILSTALTADDLMISRALLIARLGSQEARPKTFTWSAARRPSEIRDGRRWSKRFSFGGHSGLQFIVTHSHSAQSYSMTFGVRMTRGISEHFPWLIKRMSEVVRA